MLGSASKGIAGTVQGFRNVLLAYSFVQNGWHCLRASASSIQIVPTTRVLLSSIHLRC